MLVEHSDGWTVWVTVPQDLLPDMALGGYRSLKDKTVTLRATLSRFPGEESYGKAARPHVLARDGWDERLSVGTVLCLEAEGLTAAQVTSALRVLQRDDDPERLEGNAVFVISRIARGVPAEGDPAVWRACHTALRDAGADVPDLVPRDGLTHDQWDAQWAHRH